jgi:hypothetical protein
VVVLGIALFRRGDVSEVFYERVNGILGVGGFLILPRLGCKSLLLCCQRYLGLRSRFCYLHAGSARFSNSTIRGFGVGVAFTCFSGAVSLWVLAALHEESVGKAATPLLDRRGKQLAEALGFATTRDPAPSKRRSCWPSGDCQRGC